MHLAIAAAKICSPRFIDAACLTLLTGLAMAVVCAACLHGFRRRPSRRS